MVDVFVTIVTAALLAIPFVEQFDDVAPHIWKLMKE